MEKIGGYAQLVSTIHIAGGYVAYLNNPAHISLSPFSVPSVPSVVQELAVR
jgi:hypothetical protein